MSYYRRRKRTRVAAKAKTKEEKCVTPYCRNKRALNNNGYFLSHCWKCRSRILKERNPWTYVLNLLRISARRRGIDITLTVAEFKEWCAKTGYLEHRGQEPDSMTIDRIDRTKGYHIWNIQPMSHAENSAQGADSTPRHEAEPEGVYEEKPQDDNEPF